MPINESADAGPPFDSLHADVILRSSDNVDFRTFKLLLSLASPVFEDMFNMTPLDCETSVKDGALVVQMQSESSRTLEMLLGFCHPNFMPTLESLDVINDVLAAAMKFEMAAALKWARVNLVGPRFTEKQSVRAFAIACKYELEPEEQILAKETLRLLDLFYKAELEFIPYMIGQRLQAYRDDCCKAARKLTTYFEWVELDMYVSWNRCDTCASAGRIFFKSRDEWWPTRWWLDYMHEAGKELKYSPVPDTVLRPRLVEWAVKRTSKCNFCSPLAGGDIQKFNHVFSEQIEYVISQVCKLKVSLEY